MFIATRKPTNAIMRYNRYFRIFFIFTTIKLQKYKIILNEETIILSIFAP